MLNIRKLGKNDYGPYSSLIEEMYSENFTINNYYEYLFKIESNNINYVFILENGNKIVASITIMIEPNILNDKKSLCHITELLVSKKENNEDYKSMLINYVREFCKNSCDKLIINYNN